MRIADPVVLASPTEYLRGVGNRRSLDLGLDPATLTLEIVPLGDEVAAQQSPEICVGQNSIQEEDEHEGDSEPERSLRGMVHIESPFHQGAESVANFRELFAFDPTAPLAALHLLTDSVIQATGASDEEQVAKSPGFQGVEGAKKPRNGESEVDPGDHATLGCGELVDEVVLEEDAVDDGVEFVSGGGTGRRCVAGLGLWLWDRSP
jgi:hypothetical protein